MSGIDFSRGTWINEPRDHEIGMDRVVITTEPGTDLWQRSYYGFRNDNAPGILVEVEENFSFTTRVRFSYRKLFDQCGLLVYENSDFWFKASIEYENDAFSRLGSVVTNHGYSDWATTDVATPSQIWYRLSRRGPDFLVEFSSDGTEFHQMRVFHLHSLGETTEAMGKAYPPVPAKRAVRFGLYACSPVDSSFRAEFDRFELVPSLWRPHPTDQ